MSYEKWAALVAKEIGISELPGEQSFWYGMYLCDWEPWEAKAEYKKLFAQ